MIKIESIVLVEGKYDKIRLSNIVDAVIITTDGFRIFKDREKTEFLRAAAKKRGIIIMTDSDSAGQLIRMHLKGIIPPEYIKNVYLPPIKGKEKRKRRPSAEGLLGVEGTDDKIITNALKAFSVSDEKAKDEKITKADMYALGMSGDGSTALRQAVKEKLFLPSAMSPTAFLDAVNVLFSREEFIKTVEEVRLWVEAKDKK